MENSLYYGCDWGRTWICRQSENKNETEAGVDTGEGKATIESDRFMNVPEWEELSFV